MSSCPVCPLSFTLGGCPFKRIYDGALPQSEIEESWKGLCDVRSWPQGNWKNTYPYVASKTARFYSRLVAFLLDHLVTRNVRSLALLTALCHVCYAHTAPFMGLLNHFNHSLMCWLCILTVNIINGNYRGGWMSFFFTYDVPSINAIWERNRLSIGLSITPGLISVKTRIFVPAPPSTVVL